MYTTSKRPSGKLYGRGFTIWKTLPDISVDRNLDADYDAIVFGNIWRWDDDFREYCEGIPTHFLDGSDHTRIFEPALSYGAYYKRERMTDNVHPINFSIPESKLRASALPKSKRVVNLIEDKHTYSFSAEQDYYDAIAVAEYAITRKKGGWDCMRHYEIAANWTVPCFYQLNRKPATCAPHGLIDMVNVISYEDETELYGKIDKIDRYGLYEEIQRASWDWACANTCEKVSEQIINGS